MRKNIKSTVPAKTLQAITPCIIHAIVKKIFTQPLYLMLQGKVMNMFLFYFSKSASKLDEFIL